MTQLDKIKNRYARARQLYLARHPNLIPISPQKVYVCGLCGRANVWDMQSHMQTHMETPPAGLRYLIPMQFERANRKLRDGMQFIRLLVINVDTDELDENYPVGWNVLMLSHKSRVTDIDGKSMHWDKKRRKFRYWFWICILVMVTIL